MKSSRLGAEQSGGTLLKFNLQDFRSALKRELHTKTERLQQVAKPRLSSGLVIPNFVRGEESPEPSASKTSFYSKAASQRMPFSAKQADTSTLSALMRRDRGQLQTNTLKLPDRSTRSRGPNSRADSCLTRKNKDLFNRISSIAARLRNQSPEQPIRGLGASAATDMRQSWRQSAPRTETSSFLRSKEPLRGSTGCEVAQIRAFRRMVEALDIDSSEGRRCVDELIDLAKTITVKVKSSRF